MGKKQVLSELPPGNYDVKPTKVLTELPDGNYELVTPGQTNSWENFNPNISSDNPDQLENTLNDIVKTSRVGISDSEKDLLRDMLKNPKLTPEQAKESIAAIQGWHEKQKDNTFTTPEYYVKTDENGVTRPIPLGKGERPPKGYQVANVWGQTQKNADDDAWYTDLAKSAFNMLPATAKGAAEVGNWATALTTGEESEFFTRLENTAEFLKLKKDLNGGKTLYNPEEATKFSELLSSDRFDFSPESLWNTVNWAVENLPQFLLGTAEARYGIGAGKMAINAMRGVKGASEVGKAGTAASMFASSFAMQIGKNMEAGREAGLTPQDNAKQAGAITTIQAGFDAFTGLDIGAKLFNSGMVTIQKELLKDIIKQIPKQADGTLGKEGMEMLAKTFVKEYKPIAESFVKTAAKDVGGEMAQETLQEVAQNAGQQIWDNLSDKDKAKFGTDALSAKSFGEYLASGINSLGVAPVSIATAKRKYNEQSNNAMSIVKGGENKIKEFKANIDAANRRGEITDAEKDQAIFKIDTYDKYWKETSQFPDMSDEEKKDAFELSFNIEGLKSEIPESEEGLSPIDMAKINTKKELIKGLQKELDNLLLKQEIQKETKAGQATVNKVAKDNGLENEKKEGEEKKDLTLDQLLKKIRSTKADKIDIEKVPRKKISEVNTADFNVLSDNDPMEVKKIVQEHLKETEGNEMPVTIRSAQNGRLTMDIGDGKQVWFAQSVPASAKLRQRGENVDEDYIKSLGESYLKIENMPGDIGEYIGYLENRGGDTDTNNESMQEFFFKEPAYLKRLEINEYKEGKLVKDDKGKPRKKAVLVAYNKQSGKFIGFGKETKRGQSNYKKEPKEEAQLKQIIEANYNSDDIAPYTRGSEVKPTAKPEVAKPAKEPKPEKAKPEAPKRPYVKPYQEKLSPLQREGLMTDGKYGSDVIDPAIEETNRLLNLPTEELFQELKPLLFNSVGQLNDWRPNTGLSTEQFNTTLDQIAEGKNSKTVEQLYDFIDDIKTSGEVSMVQGNGGRTQKFRMPLYLFVLDSGKFDQRQLTPEEEAAEMERLQAQAQYEAQLQKERAVKGDAFKVIEQLKKVAPKVKWVYDNKLKAAAQVKGNTITVNPFYAGIDTPIHEVGHILIDSLGYNSKLIQSAIKQLKNTELWDATKKKYDELSEEQLGKEVLAEAIGREGAGIFDTVKEQSKFKQILDYIFARLKQFFGMDKNVAKSLAQQIISGIGTSNLEGKNEMVQEQRKSEYEDYYNVKELIDEIDKTKDLSQTPFENLVKTYDFISKAEISEGQRSAALNNIQRRIALNFIERSVDKSKRDALMGDIKHKDITYLNSFMKVLSHFEEAFPQMQGLSQMYDEAIFNALESAEKQKFTHRKLAEKVIKDYNSKIGLIQRAVNWTLEKALDMSHKYFGFLDNGKGQLLTVDEAKKKGLSDAQIEYLKFTRETLAKRANIYSTKDVYDVDMDVLKLSKSTSELFQTEGIVSAISSIMPDNNMGEVKIYFTNPTTGKKTLMEFKHVKKVLSDYAKDGNAKQKTEATKLLFKYTLDVRDQYKKGYHADGSTKGFPKKTQGKPTLDENGKLKGKFDGEYKGTSYSKDFYTAMNTYIDDTAHIENVSPLIPIINSIEYLAEKGIVDADGNVEHQKKYLAEWMRKWQNQHIFKSPNRVPGVDEVLKVLRKIASTSMMMFNFKAQGFNVGVGQIFNFIELGPKVMAKGLSRLFDPSKKGYMLDIAKKYKAYSVDLDSNPIRTGYGIFSSLGYFGLKWGEVLNQVSALGGLMSDKDYNSFEYKTNEHGVKELVVKDSIPENEKKELEERILGHINKVSDVHGKYGEKDRRNIMNSEFGKAVSQFKTWMPDAYRLRFGEQGRHRIAAKTAWKMMFKEGREEMRKAIRDDGGMVKHFEKDEVFKKNLRGAMIVAALLILTSDGDDESEKLEKLLSDVLFVYDPDNLKFTITRPIASVNVVEKFLDAIDHAAMNEADDFYKADGKYGDEGDSKLPGDILGLTPAQKLADAGEMLGVVDEE